MPAQAVFFVIYFFTGAIILPFAVLNFVIVNTNLVPNIKSFVISTGSMEPTVPKGSIVYTLTQPRYKEGDIITFKNLGNVSHRVIKREVLGSETYYSTKGDANKVADQSLTTYENIYGKVVATVPIIGSAILFYRTPTGILLGTVLPTLFLIFYLRKVAFVPLKE